MPQDARLSLDALAAVAAEINAVRDPAAVLDRALDVAMETLQAERGFLLLESEGAEGGFAVRVSRNVPPDQLAGLADLSGGPSASVVRAVLTRGEPVLVFETDADAEFGRAESVVLQRIQSVACVPLRLRRRQIGAIYLDSVTRRGRFTPDTLPFLTAFADQAAVALENARFLSSLRDENRQLRADLQRHFAFDGIVGQSPALREAFDTLARVADTAATVLLTGESGTGKELAARAVHYNSPRKDKPFVAIFCGALPDDLLESELFGHKKGAFTGATADKKGLFEAADGGTVFLDEVGDLSPKLQTALLRVLQSGEVKRVGETQTRTVDVRLLSATNKDLREAIAARQFREDLYYRLNTIEVRLPPLRRRRSDIALLAQHFLGRFAVGTRAQVEAFEPEALDQLERYRWPGNVRELENTVERAVALARGTHIAPEDLRLPDLESAAAALPTDLPLKEVERRVTEATLEAHDGNVSETARVLGVSRRWLHYRLKEWGEEE